MSNKVTDADREAAQKCVGMSADFCSAILEGEKDNHPNVQTLAAHRIASTTDLQSRLDKAEAENEAFRKSARACRAWHYAESQGLGTFSRRSDLCSYSEFLTQKALGFTETPDYTPVPVLFGEGNGAEQVTQWVDELIQDEFYQLTTKEGS